MREGLAYNWQVDNIDPLSIAPGEFRWVLTELNTYSGFDFAYLVPKANAFNTTKKLEQKYCSSLSLLVISLWIKALTSWPIW